MSSQCSWRLVDMEMMLPVQQHQQNASWGRRRNSSRLGQKGEIDALEQLRISCRWIFMAGRLNALALVISRVYVGNFWLFRLVLEYYFKTLSSIAMRYFRCLGFLGRSFTNRLTFMSLLWQIFHINLIIYWADAVNKFCISWLKRSPTFTYLLI